MAGVRLLSIHLIPARPDNYVKHLTLRVFRLYSGCYK